jgi:hypothetical protein
MVSYSEPGRLRHRVRRTAELATLCDNSLVPPRSNEFQRLVKVIYEQIKPEGASVTESAMLREKGSSTEREVDVLVEARLADTVVRLAVECRDRSRRDDIEWIDQLIGKYRDLPVDKIIAVSASGVTKSA